MRMTTADIARFWVKVDRSGGPRACWPWRAGRNKRGNGNFSITDHTYKYGHRALLAHRVALFLSTGKMPPTKEGMHECDYPPCCNPKHLRWGTRKQNMADAKRRGLIASGDRHGTRTHPESRPRGETHSNAKLSTKQVALIRKLYRPGSARRLGKRFKVHPGSIWMIAKYLRRRLG